MLLANCRQGFSSAAAEPGEIKGSHSFDIAQLSMEMLMVTMVMVSTEYAAPTFRLPDYTVP